MDFKRYFANLSDSLKLMLPPGTTTRNFENRIKEKQINLYFWKDRRWDRNWNRNQKLKSEKQIRILKFLLENDSVLVSDLEIFTDTSRAIIKTLQKMDI